MTTNPREAESDEKPGARERDAYVDEVARRMKREFTLLFTSAVVRAADPDSYTGCVAALALTTSVPGATRPYVTIDSISFNLDGWRYKCATPPELAARVMRYNDGEPVRRWPPVTLRPASVRKSDVTPGARGRKRGGRSTGSAKAKVGARRRWRGT